MIGCSIAVDSVLWLVDKFSMVRSGGQFYVKPVRGKWTECLVARMRMRSMSRNFWLRYPCKAAKVPARDNNDNNNNGHLMCLT